MLRSFCKMHGIGNDYIYFDCLNDPFPADPSAAAVALCDRHRSVGGDGIVLILPGKQADARMRMFNADGSEGSMCGNAIRCVGKYLYDRQGISSPIRIETASGEKKVWVTETAGGEASLLRVDMGAPNGLFGPLESACRVLSVAGENYSVCLLSMGNPHCVVFCEDPSGLDLEELGPQFEYHPAFFPGRTNTEFVKVKGKELFMRVWERGSGETLACGTGACAAAVAAVLRGFCRREDPIVVHLLGGDLTIEYGASVFMTGPAAYSFNGTVRLPV